MIKTVDMLESAVAADLEPLLQEIDICLYSGLSLMVAVMVDVINKDTEMSLKVISCPTLFVS